MDKEIKERLISVAIVEDDAGLRESMRTMIERSSECWCAGVFADAESALLKLPELAPDVVLMDINLPGMSGVDCVERLAGQLMKTHILMVTVYKDTDSIFQALAASSLCAALSC